MISLRRDFSGLGMRRAALLPRASFVNERTEKRKRLLLSLQYYVTFDVEHEGFCMGGGGDESRRTDIDVRVSLNIRRVVEKRFFQNVRPHPSPRVTARTPLMRVRAHSTHSRTVHARNANVAGRNAAAPTRRTGRVSDGALC